MSLWNDKRGDSSIILFKFTVGDCRFLSITSPIKGCWDSDANATLARDAA